MLRKIKTVACGISGGVDSAVSAHFLKQRGYEVIGVFMKNWDEVDELGVCRSDKEYEDAQYVCDRLRIPLHHVNFVKEYWNHVFSSFLADYENGRTPNPDVLCNKYIKFDLFMNHCLDNLGVDAIATGHYAKSSAGPYLEKLDLSTGVKLLMPLDRFKDQTFFLSQISQKALRKTMFPLHNIKKSEVKKIAQSIGLDKISKKKESMGICYIGTRDFKQFMQNYIDTKPGNFVDVETGEVVGQHHGVHMWTLGQRTLIPGAKKAWFVQSRDPVTQTIFVASGTDHPALFSYSFLASMPYWIHEAPQNYEETGTADIQFRYQHTHPPSCCTISNEGNNRITASLKEPHRTVTPGQFCALYDGEEVLGSVRVTEMGMSLFHQNNKTHIRKDIAC